MTFEEWYKWYNPDLDPLGDDCLEELKSAYEAGWRQGHKEGYIYRETVQRASEGDNEV